MMNNILLGIGTFLMSIFMPSDNPPPPQKTYVHRRKSSYVDGGGDEDGEIPAHRHSMLDGVRERYAVIKQIGASQNSEVYQATDRRYSQLHAVKIFSRSNLADGPVTRLQSVHREAHVLSILSHPHIVRLHHARQDEDFIYIAMEYCHRGSLSKLLCSNSRPLDEHRALSVFQQLFSAVEFMHGKGVSHRDITPDNVLMAADGTIKIAGFSSAFWARSVKAGISKRQCETPGYAAPETTAGYNGEGVGIYRPPLADMWSCGALLYTLLTCRDPAVISSQIEVAARPPQLANRTQLRHSLGKQHSAQFEFLKLAQKKVSQTLWEDAVLSRASQATRKLVEALLCVDPHQRASATVARKMCDEALKLLNEQQRQRLLRNSRWRMGTSPKYSNDRGGY